MVAYALLGVPVWHLWVRPWEEEDLEQRFGEPYRRYRRSIKCWLPNFPGFEDEAADERAAASRSAGTSATEQK